MNRDDYLLENEEYLNNLKNGLEYLEEISKELCTFGVDIKSKQWYENLIEIYIPKTFEFYDNCKKDDFNIKK